jgi:uncharacterized membrane protein
MTEKPHMPDHCPTRKWWAASKTIWGAVISALATVASALGPLLGVTMSPELIHQLGDQVLLLVQVLVGLTGTILTIYGRIRATTPLARRRVSLKP